MFNLFKSRKQDNNSLNKEKIPSEIEISLFGEPKAIKILLENSSVDKRTVKEIIDGFPSILPKIREKIREFIDANYFEFLDYNYEGSIDFTNKEGQFYNDYQEIKKDYDDQTKNALECVLRLLIPENIYAGASGSVDMIVLSNKTASDGLNVNITSDDVTVDYSE